MFLCVFGMAFAFILCNVWDFCKCCLNDDIKPFPELKKRKVTMTFVENGHFLLLLDCCWLPATFSREGVMKYVGCKKLQHKICHGYNRNTHIKFVCDTCKAKQNK